MKIFFSVALLCLSSHQLVSGNIYVKENIESVDGTLLAPEKVVAFKVFSEMIEDFFMVPELDWGKTDYLTEDSKFKGHFEISDLLHPPEWTWCQNRNRVSVKLATGEDCSIIIIKYSPRKAKKGSDIARHQYKMWIGSVYHGKKLEYTLLWMENGSPRRDEPIGVVSFTIDDFKFLKEFLAPETIKELGWDESST